MPTFNSSGTSAAPDCPRNTNAVPSVGCPANGNSSCTVKMRTRVPRALSAAGSPGSMKVVSERFISSASACICSVVSPRPSRITASELPASARSVNTSTCTRESLRVEAMLRILPRQSVAANSNASLCDTIRDTIKVTAQEWAPASDRCFGCIIQSPKVDAVFAAGYYFST